MGPVALYHSICVNDILACKDLVVVQLDYKVKERKTCSYLLESTFCIGFFASLKDKLKAISFQE